MMFAAADLVTFGEAFDVVAAHDEAPRVPPDFTGATVGVTVSTLGWADKNSLIAGREHGDGPTVRFTENDSKTTVTGPCEPWGLPR